MQLFKILLLILILNSITINAQIIETDTIFLDQERIDTINLNQFTQEKVVRYTIENVKICISVNDYIDDLKKYHKSYKKGIKHNNKVDKWVKDPSIFKSEHDSYKKRFAIIDSVLKTVMSESKKIDTVDISHQTFENIGLSSLVRFDKYIENGQSAIYDQNGIRQYSIIKKYKISYNNHKAVGGTNNYCFIDKMKCFLRIVVWRI